MTEDPSKPLDETTYQPSSKISYAESKIRGERRATELAKELGLDAIITLPVGVIGRWDFKSTPTTKVVYDMMNGLAPASFALNVTDVRDTGLGHVLALERGTPGERYIIGADVSLPKELADIIEKLSGRRPGTKMPPLPVLNALVTVLGWVGKAPTSRVALKEIYGKHFAYDNSKVKRELGLEPRRAKESLTETLRWGSFMKAFKPAMNERLSERFPPEPEWKAAVSG